MPPDIGPTKSLWRDGQNIVGKGPMRSSTTADVCIIGAGISGLSIAYELAKERASVLVIEKGLVGDGQTQFTTAQLTSSVDCRFYRLEHTHGELGSRLAAQSHMTAIGTIETTVSEEGIACGFERLDGYLFPTPEESPDVIRHEMAAAQRAGLEVVSVAQPPIPTLPGPALKFPNQGQMQPLDYLAGLCCAIERLGGRVYTQTRAHGIVTEGPARVITQSGETVSCKAIVVATNSPISDRIAIHTKQAAYTSYVIGLRMEKPLPKALYWDTGRQTHSHPTPYHYVRLAKEEDETPILLVGGEDHKTGQANNGGDRYFKLEEWAKLNFPGLKEVAYQWSGEIHEPNDGLAFIGHNPVAGEENIFVATGDAGMGMTYGPIAGIILRDLILGRPNPWAQLYDPRRASLRSLGNFTRENLNAAAQYVSWLTPGEVASDDSLAPGEGAVIRHGLSKLAVYRDQVGHVHELSAVCPHMGCHVAWNSSDKTWDCPCHGSRFSALGKVILGPATMDLAPIASRKSA